MGGMATDKKKPGRRPDPNSKRATGADRHAQPRKAFHAPQELFDALERYILDTKPQPTEAASLRAALEEFLTSRGYWKPTKRE